MVRQDRRSDCPISYALEIFGDRWTLLIIRDLMFKKKHYYQEFLMAEEKISTNILADRLSLLEEQGIVIKTDDPSHGSKYIYKLSPKGIGLVPLLTEMIIWSAKYDKNSAADAKFVSRTKRDKETAIKEISADLKFKI